MVVECDEKYCKYNDDGECCAAMIAIIDQECMTYRYKDESVYEQEDE